MIPTVIQYVLACGVSAFIAYTVGWSHGWDECEEITEACHDIEERLGQVTSNP